MEFVIQEHEKKNIQKLVSNKKTSVRIIKIIEIVILMMLLVGGFGFIIFNILDPDAYIANFRGELIKDYSLILLIGRIRIMGLLTTWILVYTLRRAVCRAAIGNKTDECISIQGDSIEEKCLLYSYRIKYQSLPTDRGLVAIMLNEIKNIKYDNAFKKITIQGKMYATWIEKFQTLDEIDITNKKEGQFIIYDYFSPSLIEKLKKYPIKINYGE